MRIRFLMGVFFFTMMIMFSSILLAQDGQPEPPRIPFQGQLRSFAGELVPDSLFPMTFRFYADSLGQQPLWSESHPQVATRNGTFSALLGSINPISLDLLEGSPLYLEMQIGENDPPLGHRMRVGTSPVSGSSQRLAGDVFTAPGLIRMFAPQPEPPEPDPLMLMQTGVGGQASIRMFAPQPEPPYPDPLDILSINSSPTSGASIRMFAPQPEPPSPDPLLLMNTGPGGQASIRMFAPQPEPPMPDPMNILNITSDPFDGGSFEMFAPQAEYGAILVNANPQVKLSCDSTRSSMLVQRARNIVGGATDSTGVTLEADSLASHLTLFSGNSIKARFDAFTNGGGLNLFNQGTEYMGIEPMPFGAGGALTMYGGAPLQAQVTLSSDGKLSLGTTNTTNILTIRQSSSTDPIADAWTTYSSRRWKTNIQPLQGSLEKVMRLQGVSYDEIEGGKHNIGLIAEEVGAVVPEVVAYEENGVDAKSVDYARLTAILIEAVKEQQKTIEQLKSEIEQLKIR